MTNTVRIEDVAQMLNFARFHLERYQSEHEKLSGRDLFAMQADFIACLHAGSSVFYSLTNRPRDRKNDRENPFLDKARAWKDQLMKARKQDFDFLTRMVDHHRGSATHAATVNFSIFTSVRPAYYDNHIEVSGAPGAIVENPLPGASPAFAPAWVMIDKLKLDNVEAISNCQRFLSLLDELVQHCKT